ncbi:hypothetical protein BB560_002893 [Smittium megazygosporum]|uniref:XPA C-terminal domain-containing protein n=1 Tax=Smittium megazygosporum TaxID=133381 RepID=A0A2T9ZDM0_9FUNG|nr:hypothetical protein BB560_002893 [Smittium megazygosporum]
MIENQRQTSNKEEQNSNVSGESSQSQKNKETENTNANNSKKRKLDKKSYIDYDLSKIKQTKGGYLVNEREYENDEVKESFESNKPKNIIVDLPLLDGKSGAPKCTECGSIDIDATFFQVYDDYLLTEGELRDPELFKVWVRPNPHKSTFSNMLLYMRGQVEAYAEKKWGSFLALDQEFERRALMKEKKKTEKLTKSFRDLRNRTRTEQWRKSRNIKFEIPQDHKHVFVSNSKSPDSSEGKQKCSICGIVVEIEEF